MKDSCKECSYFKQVSEEIQRNMFENNVCSKRELGSCEIENNTLDGCECCGEHPVVGKRYSKGIDGGANLDVCKECLETPDWDLCSECGKDIDECKCEVNENG